MVLPNRSLTGGLPQLRTDLKLITLIITASDIYARLLKVLQKRR